MTSKCCVWDIWQGPFPFEEDPTQEKKRPLLITCTDGKLTAMALYMTSKDARDKEKGLKGYDFEVEMWKAAGLREPTVIRTRRQRKISYEDLEFKIGILHPNDIMRLSNFLAARANS